MENTQTADEQLVAGLGMDIFGASAADVASSVEEEKHEGGNYVKYFELNPQNNADNTDMAIVRLVPNLEKDGKNIVKKISYKVTSDDGKKFMFDSAKTNGWKNECPIADFYNDVKNDELKKAKFQSVFAFKKPSIVLVQVLKYDANPNLVGEIMPLRIYEDVEKLIQKTISPSKEDIELDGAVPTNVFDPFGDALMLKAGMKKIGEDASGKPKYGRTFEDSKFVKAPQYKVFYVAQTNEDGTFVTEQKGEDTVKVFTKIELTDEERTAYGQRNFAGTLGQKLQSVLEFLKNENTPSHADYGYNEPSDERKGWVATLVSAVKNGTAAVLGTGETQTDANTTQSENATPATEEAKTETTVDVTSDAELDDIMNQATA